MLDCAHGAAYEAGPLALAKAGAEVIAIGVEPDGLNINEGCGSTAPRPAAEGGARARCRRGVRPRRRRRPLPGRRRTTATPSTATRSSRCSRSAMAETGRLAKDTVVATVMSNLGFVQAMKAAGLGRPPDQGRRPLRARGDAGLRLHPRRRAVRPRDHERARHHRRRHPHRAARARADGRHRAVASSRSPRWSPGSRRCWSTCRASTSRAPTTTPSWPPRSPRRRPPWATRAGSCSARPAPRPLVRVMVEASTAGARPGRRRPAGRRRPQGAARAAKRGLTRLPPPLAWVG